MNKYLSTREAAEILGVSPALVRRYIRQGRIRAIAVSPRCWLVERASVRDFARVEYLRLRQDLTKKEA